MKRILLSISLCLFVGTFCAPTVNSQYVDDEPRAGHTLYEVPPRMLVDMPTAGTLPRATFNIGVRMYNGGGGLGYVDIGLSNRFMLGISYGAIGILSTAEPVWNDNVGISVKFRIVDEMEFFPAISVGFTRQGYGAFSEAFDRYAYKSRGFYAVVSRSFYFYRWTAGWHVGTNMTREDNVDNDDDINLFAGIDATFNYNVAFLMEYDFALNDNGSTLPTGEDNAFGGKGRGYLNLSVKWLFTENLEIEFILKDLLINRRESDTFGRELRMTYIESF